MASSVNLLVLACFVSPGNAPCGDPPRLSRGSYDNDDFASQNFLVSRIFFADLESRQGSLNFRKPFVLLKDHSFAESTY